MSKTSVIGLMGKRGAGIDTAADYLVEAHGFIPLAFGDALYREVSEYYGVPIEMLQDRELKETPSLELEGKVVLHGKSPRRALQDWGMMRRAGDPLYWIRQVTDKILSNPGDYVVKDVRFLNEVNALRELDAKLVRVVRPVWEAELGRVKTDQHASETELDSMEPDAKVMNAEKDLGVLHCALEDLLKANQAAV